MRNQIRGGSGCGCGSGCESGTNAIHPRPDHPSRPRNRSSMKKMEERKNDKNGKTGKRRTDGGDAVTVFVLFLFSICFSVESGYSRSGRACSIQKRSRDRSQSIERAERWNNEKEDNSHDISLTKMIKTKEEVETQNGGPPKERNKEKRTTKRERCSEKASGIKTKIDKKPKTKDNGKETTQYKNK